MANFTTDGEICIKREIENLHSDKDTSLDDIVSRFDIVPTCKWIQDNNFERVCLQFPDNLLGVSVKIYEEIKKKVEADLYILGDTSYASCCVDTVAAMHVKSDAIVHYGRSCFSTWNIPVFTVLPKRDLDMEAAVNTLKETFRDENVKLCLFYDAEFEHENVSNYWFSLYPHSYIAHVSIKEQPFRFQGRIVKDANGEEHPADVIRSCSCIYLGSRGQTLFNYTISIAAEDWYVLDPGINAIECVNETQWFKRRRFLVEKCKDANIVGILICQLAGAHTREIISRMKQLCRVNGKKSYIVSVGKPNVAKLANFPEIEIYVMVACPENDLYSSRDFYKPIVYPFELEVALNSNREPYYTNHITDYGDLLPGQKYYCDIDHVKELTDVSLITGKIRETKVETSDGTSSELEVKQNWALEKIGQNLQKRSWQGLEQKLGETEVKLAEQGRTGIPLQYKNEPE